MDPQINFATRFTPAKPGKARTAAVLSDIRGIPA
jgi:hypothetical protein